MADTISNIMDEGTTLANFLENMFKGVADSFLRLAAEVLANDLWYQLFGGGATMQFGTATLFHKDKLAGSSDSSDFISRIAGYRRGVRETTNPSAVTEPRLGQFAQKRAFGNTTINVENKGAPVNLRETGRSYNGKQLIINAVNGSLRH